MRIAVISDIHSNIHALKEVVVAVEQEGIDMVLCAGDIVGDGAFPNECCDIVKRLADHAVVGNHDLAVVTRDTSNMNPYAAKAADWTSENLSDDSRRFLDSLKTGERLELDDSTAGLFHGSPTSVWEYVFEEDVRTEMLESAKADILVLGHTHVPFVKTYGKRCVLNPGAVGQPRDGDSRASFATIDTGSGKRRIHRLDYDVNGAADAIMRAQLPQLLADRLFSGK
jgi:putative phosphoesterase